MQKNNKKVNVIDKINGYYRSIINLKIWRILYGFSQTRSFEILAIVLILLVGFVVRLYKIDTPLADWHSWRQSDTASVSRIYLEDGINVFYPRYYDISAIQTGIFNPEGYRFVEFPIFNVLHVLLASSFSFIPFEIWGRLLSIFSATITSFFLYLLGKRYISRDGGLLAAIFYAFLPFNIYFTRVILPEPMAVMFGVVAIFLFSKYIDSESKKYLFSSAVLFSMSLLIKPYTIFYAVPLLYLVIQKYGWKNTFQNKTFYIAGILAIIPLLLWRGWMSQYPEGIPFYKWVFNGDKIRFKAAFWNWIFGNRIGHLILGGFGVFPFLVGLVASVKKNFFVQFYTLGVVLYLIIIATANVRHDYYQTIIIPAIALSLAQGCVSLWDWNQNKYLSRGILFLSILVTFITSAIQVREFYKINHPEILKAGAFVDQVVPRNARIIAPYNGDTAFLYQTKRFGFPHIELPIPELIERGAAYYVSVNYDLQTKEVMSLYTIIEENPDFVVVDLTKPR